MCGTAMRKQPVGAVVSVNRQINNMCDPDSAKLPAGKGGKIKIIFLRMRRVRVKKLAGMWMRRKHRIAAIIANLIACFGNRRANHRFDAGKAGTPVAHHIDCRGQNTAGCTAPTRMCGANNRPVTIGK